MGMLFSALQAYRRAILSHIPCWHWGVIGGLAIALTVFLLLRKRVSIYGAVCLGITVLVGLILLDAAVVARALRVFPHEFVGIDLGAEGHRLIHGGQARRVEMLSNLAVFIPFGFFLSEFLASTKRFGAWRRILLSTLAALGLSLCIEVLQLVLKVGYFEVTDLVMNTMGGFLGAGASALLRSVQQLKQVRP